MEQFNENLTELTYPINTRSHFTMLCKKIYNLEFVQGVNFEFIASLKNGFAKYLKLFGDSCKEICNSEAFVDIASAGRHRGLSTT